MCNGRKIENKNEIANEFNSFFTYVGPNLAKNIEKCDGNNFDDFMKHSVNNSMFLEPTCADEVLNVIRSCDNKVSVDSEGFNMNIVKKICEIIALPLTAICNMSFAQGVFPDNMKTAKIIPLFKSGDDKVFTNYRPVSILPQFSKVLEKLFNKRLVNFMNHNDILYNGQYGFRKNHSTSLALLDFIENITNAIDKKTITVGVFIDLSKAFDTIDHDILLQKMYRYGSIGLKVKLS